MQVIKYIEDRFESLPLRVKIELFLFPLIIVVSLIYILHDNSYEKNFSNQINVVDIEDIQMNENFVTILKNIEKFAKENSVHLENISNGNNSVKIEANSNIKNRIKFLNFLENYNNFSKIKSFETVDDKLVVEIMFDKFYEKKRIDLNISLNLFEDEKSFTYKLEAIVGNRVFINDSWFELDDKIGTLKVFKIDSNSVVLKNSYETVVLRLHKNENI